jgi:hypothetical protein
MKNELNTCFLFLFLTQKKQSNCLILVFNKNSPRAHTESELDTIGVYGKLVKYVVHSSKRKT